MTLEGTLMNQENSKPEWFALADSDRASVPSRSKKRLKSARQVQRPLRHKESLRQQLLKRIVMNFAVHISRITTMVNLVSARVTTTKQF
jgi:hypothetical protein